MLAIKTVRQAVVLAAVVTLLAHTAILANGVGAGPAPNDVSPAPAPAPAPAPVGAGPGVTASMAQIEQRGHVNNMCEAQMMLQEMIRESGGERVVGDYRVIYLLDPPLGWYEPDNGQLTWRAPAQGETQHIEAVVLDSLTGKPIPVTPTVDVVDAQGNVVQSRQLEYLWHPMADHYGANFTITDAGTYTLRVRAPAPMINRHNRQLGNRFTEPINVEFTGVQITPQTPPATETAATAPPTQPGVGAGPAETQPHAHPTTPEPGVGAGPAETMPPAAPATPAEPSGEACP